MENSEEGIRDDIGAWRVITLMRSHQLLLCLQKGGIYSNYH